MYSFILGKPDFKYYADVAVSDSQWGFLGIALITALTCPNTVQIFDRYNPAAGYAQLKRQITKASRVQALWWPSRLLIGTWRPTAGR